MQCKKACLLVLSYTYSDQLWNFLLSHKKNVKVDWVSSLEDLDPLKGQVEIKGGVFQLKTVSPECYFCIVTLCGVSALWKFLRRHGGLFQFLKKGSQSFFCYDLAEKLPLRGHTPSSSAPHLAHSQVKRSCALCTMPNTLIPPSSFF